MQLIRKIREKIRARFKPAPKKRSEEEAMAMVQESIMRASERQLKRIGKTPGGPHRRPERM